MKHFALIIVVWAAALFSTMTFGAAPEAGKAVGQLTVGGKATQLAYAYAFARKGFFDEKTEDIQVILSDMPLDAAALADNFVRSDLAKEGKLHVLEVTIDSKGQPISVTIRHSAFSHPESAGSTEDAFEPETFDAKVAAGRVFRKSPGNSFDDISFTYDVRFKALIVHAAK